MPPNLPSPDYSAYNFRPGAGLAPPEYYSQLRDWQSFYPIHDTASIDLFALAGSGGIPVVPAATTGFILINFELPKNNYGFFDQYGFIFVSGSLADITFDFRINGQRYPKIVNPTYPGNVVSDPATLERMHYEFSGFTRVTVTVDNTHATLTAEVGARVKGYMY